MTYIRHNRGFEKGRIMADDKRWMIRGVDREVRKAIKEAAKAEGLSVGSWVRRSLQRALNAAADGPSSMLDLNERMRLLDARLTTLEKSHRTLHRQFQLADRSGANLKDVKRGSWTRTRKSK
jgi:hypothetical protein